MEFDRKVISRIGVLLIVVMVFSAIAAPNQSYAAKKKKVKKISFSGAPNYVKVIKKGKSAKLKVKVTPKSASKRMTYRSKNKKIVTVSKKGTIKGKKKGTTYVTAYARDGSGKKKTIKVIVGKPVTKITLTGDNIIMNGNSDTFKATISPKSASYKKLVWKSSNTKVATVSSKGKVKYKKDGTATITAYAQDGSKVKASQKVTMATVRKSEASFIAHRGYSSKAPENSMTAFKMAIDKGFDGVECDIWEVNKEVELVDEPEEPVEPEEETSKDALDFEGEPGDEEPGDEEPGDDPAEEEPTEPAIETDFIIFHDTTIDRMTNGSGNVTDKTFEELTATKLNGGNENIPSLAQYLDLMKRYPKVQPILEIKSYSDSGPRNSISDEGAQKVVDMLDARGLTSRVLIISFGKEALLRFKEINPNIKTQFLTNSTGNSLLSDISWADANNVQGVSVNYKSLSSTAVKSIHSKGMNVGVYTLSSQLQAYTYARLMGADYITSNYKLWR